MVETTIHNITDVRPNILMQHIISSIVSPGRVTFCLENMRTQWTSLTEDKNVWYFWVQVRLGPKYNTPNFDLTKVRTHDLQIMTVHFIPQRCSP